MKSVEVTVKLPESSIQAVKRIAASRRISEAEAMRQAIEYHDHFVKEVDKGSKIILEKADGSFVQVITKVNGL